MPLVLQRRENAGGADHSGYVNIMTAGVHNADLLPARTRNPNVAGVAEASLFDYGERVHIGADQKAGTGAVFHDRHDTVGLAAIGILADVLGDRVTGIAEFGGEQGGCAGFLPG